MSASRDQSQKFTFVYQNLYQLYQKGKTAAQEAKVPAPEASREARDENSSRGLETARIIKADDLNSAQPLGIRVSRHEPPRLMGKRIEANQIAEARLNPARTGAISDLRDNLNTLKSLHERLRFMLKELEELSDTKKA